ncbi:unnamed protein product [Linum trigynum]|uniref:F-box domain-containing protein n=1 Tax=Linum trigynum TaxID=586398 RepID=A0AAV2D0V7_9ROSI
MNQLKDGCSADQISALPEVILAEILSLLTLKEAARTSVLSKRWIDLWKCVTDLDFDASKARHAIRGEDEVGCDMNLLAKERNKYIKWVNQVLERHKGPKVKSFRIKFNLNSEQSNPDCDIDRWAVFAISKRVKRMEVDLDRYCDVNVNAKGCCVLSEPCFNYIRTAEGLSNIRFLQSLILRYVNMRSEILEHFLCNCPLLEKLVVVCSHGLVKFKVAGSGSCLPLLKLQHLDVSDCDYLKEMEIHCAQPLTFHIQWSEDRSAYEKCFKSRWF